MKKARNILLALLCALLLIAGSVAGTLAYLTSGDKVTNTFTAGKVDITLDEAETDEYGVAADATVRVQGNKYKLIPNHTYAKDPTIHVVSGSEPCYLYVKFENGLSDIEAAGDTTIAAQMAALGWAELSGQNGVFYYSGNVSTNPAVDANGAVDARSGAVDVKVFENFKIDPATNNATIETNASDEIVVTAYAIQQDGFRNATEAWAAAPTDWDAIS